MTCRLVMLALAAMLPAAMATSVSLQNDLAMNLKERPVMKVVRLLQDTKAELEKELEDDKAVYELMTCWCTSNDQEKEAAIAAGKAKISELKANRKETLDEVNADHKALSDATGMRMK